MEPLKEREKKKPTMKKLNKKTLVMFHVVSQNVYTIFQTPKGLLNFQFILKILDFKCFALQYINVLNK